MLIRNRRKQRLLNTKNKVGSDSSMVHDGNNPMDVSGVSTPYVQEPQNDPYDTLEFKNRKRQYIVLKF
jgi:hypothetical protein